MNDMIRLDAPKPKEPQQCNCECAPNVTELRPLRDWRCPTCGKLLMRLSCPDGTPLLIETRCHKCGTVATMERAA